MHIEVLLSALGALAISLILTGVIRKIALAHGVLDVPNQRSSHVVPTPRGGGVAIVIGTSMAVLVLTLLGIVSVTSMLVVVAGGAAIAAVGYMDDRRRLSARTRLAVHFAAAVAAMAWLGGLPPLQIGERLITFGWDGYVLGVLGIVWTLNLFNFMDGVDGIAASEGAFITFAGALLALITGASLALPALAIAIGAACCGFLIWNWPPARIFMGDAGSGYVGYVIAAVSLLTARENPVGLLVWLILGGLFFVDATVTLVRRLLRRERVSEAHRSHAYQWLARRWGSHRRVTVMVIVVNLVWLLPCATVAALHPRWAAWLTVIALLPIAIGAVVAGAGREEPAAR